jgi:hypothetical protein
VLNFFNINMYVICHINNVKLINVEIDEKIHKINSRQIFKIQQFF